MKKLLSLIVAILFLFLNCDVKGYEVMPLPDGGRKIIYTYGELQQLCEDHKQLLAQVRAIINSKKKNHASVEIASSIASALCIIVGTVLWANKSESVENGGVLPNISKVDKNEDSKNGSMIPGELLYALGILGLVGVPLALNYSISALQNQASAIDSRIFVIYSIKQSIERFIADKLVTVDDVAQNFYYVLFVDSQGFVYQVEYGGACISHEVTTLKTKFKLTSNGRM